MYFHSFFFYLFILPFTINCRIYFGTFAVILNCSTRRVLLGLWVEPPAHPLPRTRHSACVMRHMWFFYVFILFIWFFLFLLAWFSHLIWLLISNRQFEIVLWCDFLAKMRWLLHTHAYVYTYLCMYVWAHILIWRCCIIFLWTCVLKLRLF